MATHADMEREFIEIYERCRGATMTSIERMYALYKAVEYVLNAGIPGDFVECGVWKGGSVMLIAETLRAKHALDRKIYLYDTFAGMNAPSETDVDIEGHNAAALLNSAPNKDSALIWCVGPLDEVKANLQKTHYPFENFIFVQGPVEETLARVRPPAIALLRLDTDWYESTRAELEQLFPLLVGHGVLIIDDYGHWKGSRQAVDEYFANPAHGAKILLNRIDYTGRIGVKA
jgi:hypothetical protein